MKKRVSELSDKERIKTLDALYTAVSTLRGRDAVKTFLRDLLTESERIMLGRRILVARLLLQGESFESVRTKTGAGLATIGRIERWLSDEMPGYETVLLEMEKGEDKRTLKRKYATSALFRLKKRYPLHFLLFPEPK